MTRPIVLIWLLAAPLCAAAVLFPARSALNARAQLAASDRDLRHARASAREIDDLHARVPAWAASNVLAPLRFGPPTSSPAGANPAASLAELVEGRRSASEAAASDTPRGGARGSAVAAGNAAPSTATSDGPLANRIAAAIAIAGLPASALGSVQPDADRTLSQQGDLQVRIARATVILEGLTLPQLGSMMQVWERREPQWTITAIELAPQPISLAAPAKPGASAFTAKPANQAGTQAGTSASTKGTDAPIRAVLTLESQSIIAALAMNTSRPGSQAQSRQGSRAISHPTSRPVTSPTPPTPSTP